MLAKVIDLLGYVESCPAVDRAARAGRAFTPRSTSPRRSSVQTSLTSGDDTRETARLACASPARRVLARAGGARRMRSNDDERGS
jgi:hypothetical protein